MMVKGEIKKIPPLAGAGTQADFCTFSYLVIEKHRDIVFGFLQFYG
jgi:hypothetical protein